MFLPHKVAPQSEKDHRRMNISLTHELLSIREVKVAWNKGRDIDIRKYDPTRKSIFEMASYSYKAETRFIPQQATKFTTWTFPYDHKSGNKVVDHQIRCSRIDVQPTSVSRKCIFISKTGLHESYANPLSRTVYKCFI
jgi:hypothetical protein